MSFQSPRSSLISMRRYPKAKRISNNAKIRFDATFDVGQQVGASVLEQDLVSYTYLTTGINMRYNHSSKFGVGAGTNYTYQWYQRRIYCS